MASAANRLMAAFPDAVQSELKPIEEDADFARVLFGFDDDAKDAFFPHPGAVVSLIRGSLDGGEVEVGVVGSEGFAEVHSLLATNRYRARAVVQAEGSLSRVSLVKLREVLASDAMSRGLLLAYTSAHMEQVTQNALCNGLHNIEQRLAKWLLLMRSRMGSDEIHLTHDFLAQMLGIRRSGVTLAVGTLTDFDLIEHKRNKITILNPDAVEERACSCYREIIASLDHYMGRVVKAPPPPGGR